MLLFQIAGRSHWWSLYLRIFGKRCTGKNYCTVSLLSVISKVFEKLVYDRLVDHLKKCVLFSDFQYGFRSSQSTADLLTVVSDRIVWAFNRSGATQAVALDKIWHAGLLHELNSMDFLVRYVALFRLFSAIDDFGWFLMGSLYKNIQLTVEFLKASFLVLHFA